MSLHSQPTIGVSQFFPLAISPSHTTQSMPKSILGLSKHAGLHLPVQKLQPTLHLCSPHFGAPASVKIYSLLTLSPTPSAKTFKANHIQIKWNDLSTKALIIMQTEVDNFNRSYYGKTSLYLLSVAGNFDCQLCWTRMVPFTTSMESKQWKQTLLSHLKLLFKVNLDGRLDTATAMDEKLQAVGAK
ncbi:hypothetical protein EDD16DRAFT_1522206 [Pisolithus croceorrhizus]|nr:hypothetical protein EDD16DRAFT_1522206 [Pisolithus croceorrhizus]KAI6111899.1 hypothetical protein EV401DRAFT_1890621 [Pisolithus croceorrhizus]KAI6163944.1 hypothetical protein EDD17DRAFT_1506841 [Pisolithus thermaeus]